MANENITTNEVELEEVAVHEEIPAPKKRGRKKKTESEPNMEQATSTPVTDNKAVNNGEWSTPAAPQIPMYYMHVEVKWIEKALATLPNNKELLASYIAKNAPDAPTMAEEIEAIGEEEVMDRTVNIYPKGDFYYDPEKGKYYDPFDKRTSPEEYEKFDKVEKVPFYYNNQIRGFFKDSCGLLSRAEERDENGKKVGSTESGKLTAFKKVIDGCIFVFPRRIAIEIPETYIDDDGVTVLNSRDENGDLKILQRPLRISGPTGERVAIAASEMIPTGSSMKFTIGMTSLKFKPAIIEWLNYACVHGISGWRNSGMGVCVWREIKADYTPFSAK